MGVKRPAPEQELFPRQTPEEMRETFRKRIRGTFNDLVGLELVEARPGFARLRLPVRPELLQILGVVHGGAIATLADVAGGIATRMSLPEEVVFVTLEMKLNYLSPVSEGVLVAEANPLRIGRRTAIWEVRVSVEGGKLIAFVTATYMILEGRPDGKG